MGSATKAIGNLASSMADVVTLNAFDLNNQGGGFGSIGSDIQGSFGIIPEAVKDTNTATSSSTSSTGLGAMKTGGTETLSEADKKKKGLKTKKMGARALQIPLQSTKADVSNGIAATSTSQGISI